MPHMANLAWLPLFIMFNFTFYTILCTIKTKDLLLSPSNNVNYNQNKKWQW